MSNREPTFGETIKAARLALEPPILQEPLAKALGLKQPAISAWESGTAYPEMDKLEELADLLALDLEDLARQIAAERRAKRPVETAAVG
jgi:transcriptional regulator with XRE-family HTH domain